MTHPHRPDPDALLSALQREEARRRRGKLKIFFGMAAGVGKTYAMLEAAHERQNEGVDVVVGYVETHGRAETEALLGELVVIPRKQVEYRGAFLPEMDLDAVLARRPELVLVDELAHTNAPGTRHLKRYQDVIELLEAGIDVYTTVNVQHFESRADAVRQITGITVQERLPDSILEIADEIELIDLSPEDLRKRLLEGKVYTPERADIAAQNFFRVGNLTALREMALRLTAERVDQQLQDYMQLKHISGPWKSGERLMVAVGPSPFAENLVRWTRRIAYSLEAPWLAAYIKTGTPLSPHAEQQLADNLELARSLGAEVVSTAGDNIPEALLHLAHQRNVTQIVIGRTQHHWSRNLLRGGSPTERLMRAAGDIDIVVVSAEDPAPPPPRLTLPQPQRHSAWPQYVQALFVVAIVTILDVLAPASFNYVAAGLTQLFAVLVIAIYLGRGPALAAALASALSWNFLFIEPRLTFHIDQAQDIILFMLYFLIALLTGNLTARLRQQEQQARYNSERNFALYRLARDVSAALDLDDAIRIGMQQIGRAFDADVNIWITSGDSLPHEPHPASTLPADEKEYSVALWTFDHGRQAGRDTETLPLAQGHYFPLVTTGPIIGVLGIRPRGPEAFTFEQRLLLETFVTQIALAIERELLDQAAEQAAMMAESERLYTTLLNSISHELRTPITAIKGLVSSFTDPQSHLTDTTRAVLGHDIQEVADRLNRLVENLLDMSRLDSGRLQLKREWCNICEVIGSAVTKMKKRLGDRPVSVDCAPGLPLISMDFVLFEQALINLIDNACAYTPAGTPVDLWARIEDDMMILGIEDHGPGIPAEELPRIFDKFYRVPGTATGGTGLGLSIVDGLVRAHNGTVTAENRPENGARFVIRLPLTDNPPQVREADL